MIRLRKKIALAIFCALMSSSLAISGDLVKNGVVNGEFILPDQAEKVERFAVTDIQHWIQEITGAKVPLLNAPTPTENIKIFVGKAAASLFVDDLKKLAGTDGFAIRRKKRNIYIFADRPRGVAFGVFAFLEKNTDLIWARPNSEVGIIFGKTKTLTLRVTNCIDIPVFAFRCITGGHPPHKEGANWMIRNGINRVGRGQFDGAGWDMISRDGNNLYRALKPQFKEHPEWFGYNPATKGRMCGAGEGTLCLSIPGLPEIWAKATVELIHKKEAKMGRKMESYIIGPGDNWFCCCCPECQKPLTLPDGSILKMKDSNAAKDLLFRSTQYQMFVNEAMKTLKKEVPHVKFASLAYIYLAEPPAVDIDPDLLIFFAPYPSNSMRFPLLDSRQPKVWRERFQKWQKKTKNLGFYEYYFSKPSPQAFYAAENLRALLKTGDPKNAFIYTEYSDDRDTKGLGGNNSHGWDIGAMNTWVIAKLFWNPNQDVDALYRYFIKRTYREAAPQMTKYYELIRDSWLDPKNTKANDCCHASWSSVYKGLVIDRGIEADVNKTLEAAEKAAQHPKSKLLVKRMRSVLRSLTTNMARLMIQPIEELAHDGDTFTSVQWEKPIALNAFNPTRRLGDVQEPTQRTELKGARNGDNLYLRFTAFDAEVNKVVTVTPKKEEELWPKGDHAEIWFNEPYKQPYVFAFDSKGNKYDAKGYDRDWNSQWRIVTQKTKDRWEAIIIIPLASLGLTPGEKTKMGWFCTREINHGDGKPVEISYQGRPLYVRYFPLIID